VEVETPFRFEVGDAIYKVSSKEAFTLSENACLRRLDAVQADKRTCRLRLSLEHPQSDAPSPALPLQGREFDPSTQRGEAGRGEGSILHIQADVAGSRHEFSYPLGPLEPARTPDMTAVLQNQFAKSGDTPFSLESLEAPDFPVVLIPSAIFKELRRQFYRQLNDAVSGESRERTARARKAALQDVESLRPKGCRPAPREKLAVIMDLPRDWRFPLQLGADHTILPLSKAAIHQLSSAIPRMRGSEDQIIWQFPFMLFDRDIPLYRDTIRQLHGAGFRRFEASNLSHFKLLRDLEGLHISTWHRCFSLNSQAVAAWKELGAETVTLYIEDDADNMAELLATDCAIEQRVIVYAPLPVMTTKIRLKDVHSNIPLHSDRGEAYSVSTRDGLHTISAAAPFCLTARHNELKQHGCCEFLIDLRQSPRESWNEIISAFKTGREISGTTEFNYGAELV
jgi:putative protease